ncbi:AAA family ATPase [Streptomyces sp. NPDC055722]
MASLRVWHTTHSLLAAENRLLAGAHSQVIPPVRRGTFYRVAALHRGPLDAGQRAWAASFALSHRLLLAGLGPAGAGKTTAMRVVARAVDAAGDLWSRSPRPPPRRKSSAMTFSCARTRPL